MSTWRRKVLARTRKDSDAEMVRLWPRLLSEADCFYHAISQSYMITFKSECELLEVDAHAAVNIGRRCPKVGATYAIKGTGDRPVPARLCAHL